MAGRLTPKERILVLWVCKQKRLYPEKEGKYDALDETALKGMFERLFFGTYKCLAKLEHNLEVRCITYYENEKVFSGSLDRRIRVWCADTHEHQATLEGHTGTVECLTLYGNKLFSGAGGLDDRTIRVWNADTYEHLATLEGHTGIVRSLTVYGDKLFSGAGGDDGTIRVWSADTHEHMATLRGLKPGGVKCLTLHGNKLFSCGWYDDLDNDHTIRVWNADTYEQLAGMGPLTERWKATCFTIHDNKLFLGRSDALIDVREVDTPSPSNFPISTLQGHTRSVTCLAATGSTLFSGSEDESVRVWSVDTYEPLAVLQGHTHWLTCLCSRSSGTTLCSGSVDNNVLVWRFISAV